MLHKNRRVIIGAWSDIAVTNGNFGLEDGDYIGLPTAEASWHFQNFTVEDYEALKARIASGEITVDNSSDDGVKPTVSEYTEVNYSSKPFSGRLACLLKLQIPF